MLQRASLPCAFPSILKDGWNQLTIAGEFYKVHTDYAWVSYVLSAHGDSFHTRKLQMITNKAGKKNTEDRYHLRK